MDIISMATHGLPAADAALACVRVATGVFFAASGYNKLFNGVRHATIMETMQRDKVPFPKAMAWWVPANEFVFGTLLAVGFASAFSAAVLAIILMVACCCEARSRVDAFAPINAIDKVDDWLYLPEVVYLFVLAIPVFVGHGAYALDALLFAA